MSILLIRTKLKNTILQESGNYFHCDLPSLVNAAQKVVLSLEELLIPMPNIIPSAYCLNGIQQEGIKGQRKGVGCFGRVHLRLE